MKRTRGEMLRLLGITMAVAGTVLAGCGSGGGAPAESAGGTDAQTVQEIQASEAAGDTAAGSSTGGGETITMWGWNSGEMEVIFEAYKEATGADVTLDYVTVQQVEAFQKLQTTVSAGLELPDIVPSEVNQRGAMISLGIWEDLSKEPYNFDTSLIFDYQVPLCSSESGELAAIPHDISTAGLAYKRDLAIEYLGTDDPDELQAMFKDWESFMQKGIEVKEASNGEVFMFASLTNVKQIMDGQNPQPIITDNQLDMTSPGQTLDWMIKFRDAGIVDNILESSVAYSASYADKKHIFYPCAGWTPNFVIAPNDPEGKGNWGLMVPPEGCFSWGGSSFMIPKEALHKQAAYDFIAWLSSEEGARKQRELVAYNTSNTAVYQDPEFATYEDEWFGGQNIGEILFTKAMENIQVRPVNKNDATIMEVWTLVTEAVNSDASIDYEGACEMFKNEMMTLVPELTQ